MSLDFPGWLRVTHAVNILFLSLLVRSGLEILSAHPKLYWNEGCRLGSEWLRFTRKQQPKDQLWTSRDEEVPFSSWIALPGHRHLGLGRHWHFASVIIWLLTGLAYAVLLFATGEWRRIIPTSWDIVPNAWDALVIYLQLQVPEAPAYNGLQQLSYAAVVFLLAPFSLATGAAMSPAIAAQFPRYPAIFGGRQGARSLHFVSMLAFVAFTMVHTAMVVVHGLPEGLATIILGEADSDHTLAIALGIAALIIIVLIHIVATRVSFRSPRGTQRSLGVLVRPLQRLASHAVVSRQDNDRQAISPFFRVNGRPPGESSFEALAADDFADWRLELGGMVESPLCLSLNELKAMPAQTQITTHHCIQGWSSVGEWTGVCLSHLLDQCGPLPSARYAVLYGLDNKSTSEPDPAGQGHYYEVIDLALARQPQTILAYEMNREPLTIPHGAPLRLRLETQLGFKMVKYLRAIELVDDYRSVGDGMGGWREDNQQYSREAGI